MLRRGRGALRRGRPRGTPGPRRDRRGRLGQSRGRAAQPADPGHSASANVTRSVPARRPWPAPRSWPEPCRGCRPRRLARAGCRCLRTALGDRGKRASELRAHPAGTPGAWRRARRRPPPGGQQGHLRRQRRPGPARAGWIGAVAGLFLGRFAHDPQAVRARSWTRSSPCTPEASSADARTLDRTARPGGKESPMAIGLSSYAFFWQLVATEVAASADPASRRWPADSRPWAWPGVPDLRLRPRWSPWTDTPSWKPLRARARRDCGICLELGTRGVRRGAPPAASCGPRRSPRARPPSADHAATSPGHGPDASRRPTAVCSSRCCPAFEDCRE